MELSPDKPEALGFDAKRLARITEYLKRCTEEGKAAGFGALIARRGRIAYEAYLGKADIESAASIDPSTIYRIYSMSKPITCTAALSLWEEGAFGLLDPIEAYLPEFAKPRVLTSYLGGKAESEPAQSSVTLWNLFTHTAGIPYGTGESAIDQLYADERRSFEREHPNATTKDIVELIASLPLAFNPGTGWKYGFAHDILGRFIEVITGKPFGKFLTERIFEPLGMRDTGFWVPTQKIDRLASLYDVGPGGKLARAAHHEDRAASPPFESGGGGMVSTVGDYARFCQMLLSTASGARQSAGRLSDDEKILSPQTVRLMATSQLSPAAQAHFDMGNKIGYGYGLGVRVMINPSSGGRLGSLGEFGWDGAASTWMCVDPAEDLIAVLMLQLRPYASYGIADRFHRMMYAALG